jgi:membrane fusion protein
MEYNDEKEDEKNYDRGTLPEESLMVMTRPLFRPTVLEARQEQELGTVLLAQPISIKVLTLMAIAIAVGLVAFSFWGDYTRKAQVRGFLAPRSGLIKIYSQEAGTIVERRVSEGQRVSKGDVLFVVSMERRTGEAVEAQAAAIARMRERRASLEGDLRQQDFFARIERESLEQRTGIMESELAQLAQEVTTQQRRVASAEGTHARYRQLFAESLVSEEQVQDKLRELLDQQGKLQALERSQISLTREIETLRASVASSELKASTLRTATQREVSALEQEVTEYESRRTFVVVAPVDGTASALLADRGHTANPTHPLVSILPAGSALEAQLLVPSHSIGFLAPNQTVFLRHEAFPYQRFGSYQGHITQISKTLILPGETALPVKLSEPAYRVTVALDSQSVKAYGEDFPLQAGMLLDADIWLDRRRLYEWLLDPLYSVMGRV